MEAHQGKEAERTMSDKLVGYLALVAMALIILGLVWMSKSRR